MSAPGLVSVLFLCTRNSARSQMAEAILRARGGSRFRVASAGSDPGDGVHPLAAEVIRELGGDPAAHSSKGIDDVLDQGWQVVVTVCDQAQESCPVLPGATVKGHWGVPDPAAAEGSLVERRAAFRAAAETLSRRIDAFLALVPETLDESALRLQMRELEAGFAEAGGSPSSTAPGLVLFSDVHANLPALEAVLANIDARGDATAVYHLGDLVGYAPWPDEVVDLIHRRGIPGVAGNYDSTTATHYKHCGCRYEDPRQEELSHESYAWTLEHTSAESKRRLGALPFRLDVRPLGGHTGGPRAILVHGNPTLNTFYWTEDRDDAFCLKMAAQTGAKAGDLIAFGHTHKPWHRVVEGVHFVNTGSVGRPKDGDPRAGYVRVTLAEDGWSVAFVRVGYDVERTAAAIVASTLPDEFADFLRTGGK